MKNLNLLKVLTLAVLFFHSFSFASSSTESVSELSLRYRMMSNDYQTSSELVEAVFSNFIQTQRFNSQPLNELTHSKEFLAQLQKFSISMSALVGQYASDEQKKNSLETIVTILSESATENEKLAGQSLPKVYDDYLKSLMKRENVVTVTAPDTSSVKTFKIMGFKVNVNEAVKTVGTYGIWGFWFVTATSGVIAVAPNMENFLYYPAFAMFIASGPFSVSNQLWSQVFERLEKKAALKHQSALQYMKDKVRSVKFFGKGKSKVAQCTSFYQK